MLVKFTRTIEGGEARGYIGGRTFDWPQRLIGKFRADYGEDILEFVDNNHARANRIVERRAQVLMIILRFGSIASTFFNRFRST